MANVQFSDSTFNDADWQTETVTSGNGGKIAVNQSNTKNDRGFFREITNTVYQKSRGVNSDLLGLHWRVGATYNPQAQGEIVAIHYSEDAILIRGFGEGQAAGLALRQKQQVYLPVSRLITPEFNWTHKELRSLQAQDFVAIGTIDQHPDFSEKGTPIQFGFFRANTTTNNQYSITSGIDNWSVSINPTASASEASNFTNRSTDSTVSINPTTSASEAAGSFPWLVIVSVGVGLALFIALWKQK